VRIPSATACVQASPQIKTVSTEAVEALEQRRRQRMRELAGWQPNRGWLIPANEPTSAPADESDLFAAKILLDQAEQNSLFKKQAE
jgi:hypothetical protein